MDEWAYVAYAVVQKVGVIGALALAGIAYFAWRFDVFKSIIAGRTAARQTERDQNWEDAQQIIDRLEKEVDRIRGWRASDAADYERQIAALRGQLADERGKNSTLTQIIASSERGNSRLRHALNNICTADAFVRKKAREAGVDIPPFPVAALMELDDEYGDRLRDVMKEFC